MGVVIVFIMVNIEQLYIYLHIYIYINKYVPHILNIRMEPDHHQLIMPPTSKNGSNTFLERSIMYTAQYEWNKLSEHIRTILIVS